ncbi:MAG: RHS repeat-associated core domain-containing protein [Dehalococcoidia bacterium]
MTHPFRFTGELQDPEVRGADLGQYGGLYYLRARFYDPANGRFLSRDPWMGVVGNPQSQHAYTYVRNNPARYVDPLGLWSLDPRDLGYLDFSVSAPCWGNVTCPTVGVQWQVGTTKVHPYVGASTGVLFPGVSLTLAPGQSISEGMNCAFLGASVSVFHGFGPAAQFGVGGTGKEGGNWFHEYGISWSPGLGSLYASCYYVFPSIF